MCGQFLAATNMISDNILRRTSHKCEFFYYCGDINRPYADE